MSFSILEFIRKNTWKYIIPFFILGLVTVGVFLQGSKNIYPALSRAYLKQAYQRFAAYEEKYLNFDQYIATFPVDIYSLYKVDGYRFYIEKHKMDFIKSPLRSGHRWEPYLSKYMTQYIKKGSQVVDVGAHIGTHTLYFSMLAGNQGEVYAFEPQKKIFIELNANLLANDVKNVKTYRYAIGGSKGTIEMNRADRVNEGGTAVGQGGDLARQITLDSLHLKNVSFIKIDVEGYEDHVLDGARHTIKENKPVILCEIQGQVDRKVATLAEKSKINHTLSKFKALGYEVTRVADMDYLAIPKL